MPSLVAFEKILMCTSCFSMDKYVDFILSVVTQRFYLLNQLKNQGLSINVLNILFHALIVSRIVCALPAFSAFLSERVRLMQRLTDW